MSTLFGGGTSGASQQSQSAQIAANAATQRFIEQRTAEARADVKAIFPQAQQLGAQGFQGALDVISGGIPQQLGAFQQGNVGAQQVTAQTLPQIQNAILGLPVNQAVFAPQEITTDLSFLQGLAAPGLNAIAQPTSQPVIQPPPVAGPVSNIFPAVGEIPFGANAPFIPSQLFNPNVLNQIGQPTALGSNFIRKGGFFAQPNFNIR